MKISHYATAFLALASSFAHASAAKGANDSPAVELEKLTNVENVIEFISPVKSDFFDETKKNVPDAVDHNDGTHAATKTTETATTATPVGKGREFEEELILTIENVDRMMTDEDKSLS